MQSLFKRSLSPGIGVALMLAAFPAFAQEPAALTIDTASIMSEVIDATAAVLMGVMAIAVPFAVRRVIVWLGIKNEATAVVIERETRQYVERALSAGIALGVARAKETAGDLASIRVHNDIARAVVEYARETVPDGLAKLGVVDPNVSGPAKWEKLSALARARTAEYFRYEPNLMPAPTPERAVDSAGLAARTRNKRS